MSLFTDLPTQKRPGMPPDMMRPPGSSGESTDPSTQKIEGSTERMEPATEKMEPRTEKVETPADVRAAAEDGLEDLTDQVELIEDETDAEMKAVTARYSDAPAEVRAAVDAELGKNSEELRKTVESAKSELDVLLDELRSMEEARSRADLKELMDRRFADFGNVLANLPDAAKADPDILAAALENFKNAISADKEIARMTSALDAAGLEQAKAGAGEAFAEALKNVDADAKVELLTGALEQLPPDIVLHAGARAGLNEGQMRGLLLNAAAGSEGPELVGKFPDLYAGMDKADLALAFAERNPAKAFELAAGLDKDRAFDIAEAACENDPSLAKELDARGFSEVDKLAIGLRMVKRNPEAFFRFRKEGGITLTAEEEVAVGQDLIEAHPGWFPHAAAEFRYSSDTIAEIIGQYPESMQDSFLKALKIPGPEGMKVQEALARLGLRGPEVMHKEAYERGIAHTRSVERALLMAIESSFPERAAIERQRAKAESELHGDIKRIGDLASGSANSPLYVSFEGRPLPAVYKPRRREHGFGDGKPPIREGVAPGDNAMREWLVYQIDKALQLDLVPTTVVRDGPEGFGSVQEWRVGEVAYKEEWKNTANRAELQRIAFLDVLIDNSDRHDGNFLVSPDGEVQAIDNGYVFSEKPAADGLRSYPLEQFQGQPVGDDIRDRVDRFRGAIEVQKALWEAFQATFGYNSPKAREMWQGFMQRMEAMAPSDRGQDGTYPAPTWH